MAHAEVVAYQPVQSQSDSKALDWELFLAPVARNHVRLLSARMRRTVTQMGRIIGVIVGIVAIVNGFGILTNDNCESVSFGGRGGGRVVAAMCYGDGSGALPGFVAGLGMLFVGLAIIALSIRKR